MLAENDNEKLSLSRPSINFLIVSHQISRQLICFVLWVSRCFFEQSAILAFFILVEKVNIYNKQLNIWCNNWRLHNWLSKRTRLTRLHLSFDHLLVPKLHTLHVNISIFSVSSFQTFVEDVPKDLYLHKWQNFPKRD